MTIHDHRGADTVIAYFHNDRLGGTAQLQVNMARMRMLVHVRQPFLNGPIQCMRYVWRRRQFVSKIDIERHRQSRRFGEFADKPSNRRFDGEFLQGRHTHGRNRAPDVLQALQRQPPGATNVLERHLRAFSAHLLGGFELHVGDR